MKVHLIRTQEFSTEDLQEVIDLLTNVNEREFDFLDSAFVFHVEGYPILASVSLSEHSLFDLCSQYRKQKRVDDKDFVILLTSVRHTGNFFSLFDYKNNAFVHTEYWNYYLKAHRKYPIAYEIIANLLQSIMKLELSQCHTTPIGCMNDMCYEKWQIIIKLRTGDICPACLDLIKQQNISAAIINHVLAIFETVSKDLKWAQGFRGNIEPTKTVKITPDGTIYIDKRKAKLTLVEKALYIFFLRQILKGNEGIPSQSLEKYANELHDIYSYLIEGGKKDPKDIMHLANTSSGNFRKNKSSLKKKISEHVGANQANYYILDKDNQTGKLRIDITRDLIEDSFGLVLRVL